MRVRKLGSSQGIVLPSLILLTLILFVLTSAVLMRGTSSLRTATFDQQTDQAIYAAETGIARAVEEWTRSGEKEFEEKYTGTLDHVGAKYTVLSFEAGDELPTGAPELPPNTVYLLAEGESANGTKRRTGALFRMGLGPFEAGIVTKSLTAVDSDFNAYRSTVAKNPEASRNDNTAMMANLSVPTGGADQFNFDNTVIRGGVFVAPGTQPATAIKKSGTTKVGRESVLDAPITTTPIVVPTDIAGGTSTGEEPGSAFDGSSLVTSSVASTDLAIGWNETNKTLRFKDMGIGFSRDVSLRDIVKGNVTTINLNNDGNNRIVTIAIAGDKMTISYKDHSVGAGDAISGSTSAEFAISSIFNSPLNPATLEPGEYETVTIEAGRTTVLKEGTFLIENLVIEEGGTLKLPDKSARIYVESQLAVKGKDTLVNESESPPNLQIFYTGKGEVELSGGSKSYFTLIAPEANILLDGGPDLGTPTSFYGALLGSAVKVINTNFYYDTDAEKVGTGQDGTTISLLNRHRL